MRVEDLTDEQIKGMSNEELKDMQRDECCERIDLHKKRMEFSMVNIIFFIIVSLLTIASPAVSGLFSLIGFSIALVFILLFSHNYIKLKIESYFLKTLEAFFIENNL